MPTLAATPSAPMIFPNPNNGDLLRVRWSVGPETDSEAVRVQLLDLTGKLIQQSTLNAEHGMLNGTLQLVGSIPSGLYLVELTNGHTTFTERLVIQR